MSTRHTVAHAPPATRIVPPWLAVTLAPLGWLYRLVLLARAGCYRWGVCRPLSLGAPSIAVGNLTVGGAGKTPIAEYLARLALRAGRRPAILTRGYGRRGRSALVRVCMAESAAADPSALGDEPYLLALRNPELAVIAGADRVAAARYARIAGRPDLFVLDDAFQHLRVARDCNVLLIDAERGLGNERMLPLGPLREPLAAMARADVILITKANLGPAQELRARLRQRLRRPEGRDVLLFTVDYLPTVLVGLDGGARRAPETLRGTEVAALSGIAQPQGFRRTLQALGAVVAAELALADHVPYEARTLRQATAFAARQAAAGRLVVTTEKDAVKLRGRPDGPQGLWVLEMGVRPEPGAEQYFFALIKGFG